MYVLAVWINGQVLGQRNLPCSTHFCFSFSFVLPNRLRKQGLICSWFHITGLCGLQVTAEFSHILEHRLYKGKITAVKRKHWLFLLQTFRYSLRTKKAMTHNSQSSKMKQKALGSRLLLHPAAQEHSLLFSCCISSVPLKQLVMWGTRTALSLRASYF